MTADIDEDAMEPEEGKWVARKPRKSKKKSRSH